MSFENSQVSYVHLVSFPSCWLPPKNTLKILIVGLEQPQLEGYVPTLQNHFPEVSFAFYFVPNTNFSDLEHLDWLFINQHHMDAVWVQVTDWDTLAVASTFCVHTTVYCQSSRPEIEKLMENHRMPQRPFVDCVAQVCIEKGKAQ